MLGKGLGWREASTESGGRVHLRRPERGDHSTRVVEAAEARRGDFEALGMMKHEPTWRRRTFCSQRLGAPPFASGLLGRSQKTIFVELDREPSQQPRRYGTLSGDFVDGSPHRSTRSQANEQAQTRGTETPLRTAGAREHRPQAGDYDDAIVRQSSRAFDRQRAGPGILHCVEYTASASAAPGERSISATIAGVCDA